MNSKRKKRLVMIIIMVLGVGVTVSLVLLALNKNINVYYTPSQLTANLADRNIRIGGLVKKHSLHRLPNSLKMSFTITDLSKEVAVFYDGIVPSLFREGQGVVVEGHFDNNNRFTATQVLAKHDEKYMPPGINRK